MLRANRTLFIADLYQVSLISGWQSRTSAGMVARWTDRDYPIVSSYLNNVVGAPIQWPLLGSQFTGTFYPQRMKRGQISLKVGFEVSTFNVEVFTNDTAVTDTTGLGPVTVPLPIDLSIPSYRDAFAVKQSDNSTAVETLKQAAWRGELDQAYFFIYRAFFSDDPRTLAETGQATEPFGVMPLFTGYIKQSDVTRLSVKFTVGSLIDIFTTTQTPTQLIQPGDRGGSTTIPIATIPQLFCNAQGGSTPLILIGDGTAPDAGVTQVFDEPHFIPSLTPFHITVAQAALFNSNIRVRDASTGNIFGVGSGQDHYTFTGAGGYTFSSLNANQEVAISYTFNAPGKVDFTNGWLQYNYGTQFTRPASTPVIRQVYAVSLSPGHNIFYLFEPLPIAPSAGDSFTVYELQPLDSVSAGAVPGFDLVPRPESSL